MDQDAERLSHQLAGLVHRAGFVEQSAALEAALSAATEPPAAPAHPPRRAAEEVARVHLAAALSSPSWRSAVPLSRALGRLVHRLRWCQTAAYVAAPPHEDFLGRYAHATVLGSSTSSPLLVDPTHTAAVGILLLGSPNYYPPHHHPADEIYLPLTDGEWSSGPGAPFAALAPGHLLHHRPHQVHAARTTSTGLVALYLWTGDTTTSARLC